jgi:hypothetical protein
MSLKEFIFIFLLLGLFAACGEDSSLTTGEDYDPDTYLNTEKLISTPFEGLTIGDDLSPYLFSCGRYRTDTITSFPIPIFTALFTETEEIYIKRGIDAANEAIGFTAYEFTDTWSDDVRVIYKVDVPYNPSASALTLGIDRFFNNFSYSENQSTDWTIQLAQTGINKWVVAHELGHASGIVNHNLIDYENNVLVVLEENSVMGIDGGTYTENPAQTDYNYMMVVQGQIMLEHLGEEGELNIGPSCD